MHPTSIQEEILRDVLASLGLSVHITCQRMMGGFGVSLKGHQFAHFCGEGTGLRLSPEDQVALLALKGAKPLRFASDPARSAKFILVPEAMLDQLPVYGVWVKKAVKFASGGAGNFPDPKRVLQKPKRGLKK